MDDYIEWKQWEKYQLGIPFSSQYASAIISMEVTLTSLETTSLKEMWSSVPLSFRGWQSKTPFTLVPFRTASALTGKRKHIIGICYGQKEPVIRIDKKQLNSRWASKVLVQGHTLRSSKSCIPFFWLSSNDYLSNDYIQIFHTSHPCCMSVEFCDGRNSLNGASSSSFGSLNMLLSSVYKHHRVMWLRVWKTKLEYGYMGRIEMQIRICIKQRRKQQVVWDV